MDVQRELIKGNMPTLILAALQDGPRHGYALTREIEARSGQILQCKEGTLYPILHTLESEGLVAGQWEHGPGERPRKVYALTDTGRAALEQRARTFEIFAAAMRRVLRGDEHEESDPTPVRRPRPRRARPVPEPNAFG